MTVTLSLLLPLAMAAPQGGPGCPPNAPCPPARMMMMPGVPGPVMFQGQPCPPLGPPAPVLAGKVIAPAGVTVTALPGTPAAKAFAAPATFGFRPGYSYTLQLDNLPNHPGRSLYPVLQVFGSLVPRPGLKYMEFPAPILVTQDDIEKAFASTVVTKVIYLEDPTRAIPVDTTPDTPLELGELTEADALKAAAADGRIVAVLRFGDRKPDADELARAAVPGTVLLPGEQTLKAPAAAPAFAQWAVPMYDPILGPKPASEECLTDGGDKGAQAGIGPGLRLGGLDPTDVALTYTLNNKRRVATSNEVCVCSPRYVIRRVDLSPAGVRVRAMYDVIHQRTVAMESWLRLPTAAVMARERPVETLTRLRSAMAVAVQGTHTFVGLSAPQILYSVTGTRSVAVAIEPEEITNYPNEFVVTKSVEPTTAVKPGDVVTFTIQYHNGTRAPATDLMLSDSLSGRLEYVPGSAQSDRPANVTTVSNEVGSVVVRFEIPGPVPPGQGGTIKFQAKVR
jgi:uncharacterized repeat protein (TIGR01451 family)